jgi:hypothetical protein
VWGVQSTVILQSVYCEPEFAGITIDRVPQQLAVDKPEIAAAFVVLAFP